MTAITAAMVVKGSETDRFRACLESISGAVGYIVCIFDRRYGMDAVVVARGENAVRVGILDVPLYLTPDETADGFGRIHMAEARNRVLEEVSSGWVLTIDADEVLERGENLRAAVERAESGGHGAVWVPVVSVGEGGAEIDRGRQLRLFKKTDRVHWRHPAHNQLAGYGSIAPDVAEVTIIADYSDGMAHRRAAKIPVLERYFSDPEGDPLHAAYHLARTFATGPDWERVLLWGERARALCRERRPNHAQLWFWLALAAANVQGIPAASKYVAEGLRKFPGCPDIEHAALWVATWRWWRACESPGKYSGASGSARFLAGLPEAARLLGMPFEFTGPESD